MNTRQRRTVERRLTHRSRSAAASVALGAVALAAAWLGTEAVLAALGLRALALSPGGLVELLASQPVIAWTAAGVAGAIGVVLIVLALTPGRHARHIVTDERSVIVLDDRLFAGALSRAAASAARVPADQVSTGLSRRTARIEVVPTSGYRVATEEVSAAVDDAIRAIDPARPVSPRVEIRERGMVIS